MSAANLPINDLNLTNRLLQALVRSLVAKGVLSEDDVCRLLLDAASNIETIGGRLTPEAAQSMARNELQPAFLATSRRIAS